MIYLPVFLSFFILKPLSCASLLFFCLHSYLCMCLFVCLSVVLLKDTLFFLSFCLLLSALFRFGVLGFLRQIE